MSNTHTRRLTAADLIAEVCDAGSFESWDEEPRYNDPSAEYEEVLRTAREKSGADESVVTGAANVEGRRIALIVSEFGFIGGSLGVTSAQRVARAIRRATEERIPILAGPASGGTRMQEGTRAFLAMIAISAAVADHKAARLPYLVYLRHPTTGGVLASWGSLGHVTVAETGALIGFLGPRVFEAIHGSEFPAGVQRAENLFAHGLLDAVVDPSELRPLVAKALDLLLSRPPAPSSRLREQPPIEGSELEAVLRRSRDPDRPGVRALVKHAARDVLPLSGTSQGERSGALLIALCRFGEQACVLIGQDRKAQRRTPMGPAALRSARRAIAMAAEIRLPIVTVIDTPGAELSQAAEEGGMAGEIARCLQDLVRFPGAIVSVLLGEGSGGGALALLPSDVSLAAQNSWLAPLPPEGASALLFGDTDHVLKAAATQRIDSLALLRSGAVDRVIPEDGDTSKIPAEFSREVADWIEGALAATAVLGDAERTERRAARFARYLDAGVEAEQVRR